MRVEAGRPVRRLLLLSRGVMLTAGQGWGREHCGAKECPVGAAVWGEKFARAGGVRKGSLEEVTHG